MAMILNTRTIVGTIVDVYEKRQVGKDNTSVINFRVAVTPSVKDEDGEWTDGETDWVSVTAWRRLADNVEVSFKKGDRVIVIGRQEIQPEREDPRTGKTYPAQPNITADFVGVDLSFHGAKSLRNGKNNTTALDNAEDDEEAPKRSSSSRKSKSSSKSKASAKKKREPEPEDDDLDDEFDEFDDFDDEDDDDLAF